MHGNKNLQKELFMFSFQWQCKTIDNTEGEKTNENLLQYSNTYNKCVLLSLRFILKIVNNTIPINT